MRRVAIAAAVLLAGTPLAAAQEWPAVRDALLEMLGDALVTEGYVYAGFAHEGTLADGQSEDVPIRLGPGLDFAVVGECQIECDNLDLALFDAAGGVIASDIMPDEFPLLEVSLRDNGPYRLRVRMTGCRAAACRYAVQPMVRARGRSV